MLMAVCKDDTSTLSMSMGGSSCSRRSCATWVGARLWVGASRWGWSLGAVVASGLTCSLEAAASYSSSGLSTESGRIDLLPF